MAGLRYFDSTCFIGRVPNPYLLDRFGPGDLLGEMDTAGIEEALVFHTHARDCDPAAGNRFLSGEIEGNGRLHPVWVVMPHDTGEIPEPPRLLREMERNGVRAVRMYPGKEYHSYSLAEWNSGSLLAALEEVRVPLMLDIETVGWDEIAPLLAKHPHIPVIATNVSYRHNRFLYPLFARYGTLHVETSRFFGAGAFEDVVARFGSRRLLFGTGMPGYTGCAAVSMLTYADISPADKEAIAGGNLRALLDEAFS
jgi:hypothetical protein